MNRGKFEPTNSDSLVRWQEKNCERCLRCKIDESDWTREDDSCEWENEYTLHAFMGCERPSDEIINSMFNLPLCSGLERSDLEELINPSNNSNSSIQEVI